MTLGLGKTFKYFFKRGETISLETKNPSNETIEFNFDEFIFCEKSFLID
tara:strand:- start:193 stop:339 length:147 start_codon:yes stop_codon:yes gene_type:complete